MDACNHQQRLAKSFAERACTEAPDVSSAVFSTLPSARSDCAGMRSEGVSAASGRPAFMRSSTQSEHRSAYLHRGPCRLHLALHHLLQRSRHDLPGVTERLQRRRRARQGAETFRAVFVGKRQTEARTSTVMPSVRKIDASPRDALGSST